MKLEKDIQEYQNDIQNSESRTSHTNSDKRSDKDRSGFLSHLVDSMSFTSVGSFRSVEDERADYRKKGSKFLKRAEKLRRSSSSGSRGLLQTLGRDRT
jgi:hypothetical protein